MQIRKFYEVDMNNRYFGFVEQQNRICVERCGNFGCRIFIFRAYKTVMIINCKDTSKIAAVISPNETENIKNYLKKAVMDFCAEYYDQIYYERWFSLNTVFCDSDFYKQKPLNAVYGYYISIGKNEKDATVFALLDLNCLLEEVLTESNKVFTKAATDKTSYLPSYILISETLI